MLKNNYEYNAPKAVAGTNLNVAKNYSFCSANGTASLNPVNSRISTDVVIGTDRMYISTKPEKFNTVPVVFFQDIANVVVLNRLNSSCWLWIIITGLMGYFFPLFFIFTIWIALSGSQSKISIYQRNGREAVIYVKKKAEAQRFASELRALLNAG